MTRLDNTASDEHRIIPTEWRPAFKTAAILSILFLAFYNLTDWPLPWYDEGSHLHVPKTLVCFGVYADYSSEGFRYYGPTVGVGPTVMLPIAGAFRLFGVGLLQARVVMALFLLATIWAFYRLSRQLGHERFAWVATALLVTSRGVSLIEYGRQALGEVPGLLFMLAGLLLWFAEWERARWGRLAWAGLLLGLSMVTKQQYLLVLAPTLLAVWVLNLVYYRSAPQRVFLVPGLVSAACFLGWQVYLIVYLGPATASDNLRQYREFTSGAALVFNPELMWRALTELIRPGVYLGLLLPIMLYTVRYALPRTRAGHHWAALWVLVAWNLVWYVIGSVSWIRYAFPALAVAALFMARAFADVTGGFNINVADGWRALRRGEWRTRLGTVSGIVLSVMIIAPFALTARQILQPPFNAPAAMANYLTANVPPEALIETWEPEMGFLTHHNYHFPEQIRLNTAVKYVWQSGTPPAEGYDFVHSQKPDYVLVGAFARWVDMYPPEVLAGYTTQMTIGPYQLYTAQP